MRRADYIIIINSAEKNWSCAEVVMTTTIVGEKLSFIYDEVYIYVYVYRQQWRPQHNNIIYVYLTRFSLGEFRRNYVTPAAVITRSRN